MNRDERMVEFRTRRRERHIGNGKWESEAGEECLMRVSAMLCLFPEHHQIRTIENGWTVDVFREDWDKVERAFRSAYLGREVHAQGRLVVNDKIIETVSE